MVQSIRLAIVDDHPIFLAGLRRAFERIDGIDVVAEGENKDAAVQLANPEKVDLMLIDIGIPGGGLEAAGEILERHPSMKIIMLTGSDDDAHLEAAIALGVQGYVLKGAGKEELHDAITAVLANEPYISSRFAARLLFRQLRGRRLQSPSPQKLDLLSSVEQRVADLVAEGLPNREIADRLGLTLSKVKGHMTQIMRKLGVRNRVEVMRQRA